ncbi:MAG: hypothetical protein LQ350_004273 [Teloschistes chrysophthalmus]|nr:MAG: hypothetical protein LQ350_004273 [Niorma chrysophthalma]
MADASDIITYIGVPLAVLGVLPIFYTFLNSFFTLRNIKRSLKKSGLEATTRGSFMAGVIEVSVPRFTITPLDRKEDEYWTQGLRPSFLKGGTWTTFNWNQIITSHAMQRVQYSSDLKVPQAEIDLEELFEYLLDRGAVPDAKGIHMLRVSGLWTPTGTSLMLSPDGTQTALRISMPDDSDGVLSLALQWKPEWNRRDRSSLPPGWMRLHFPVAKKPSSNEKAIPSTVERAAELDLISSTKTDDDDSVPLETLDSKTKPRSDDSREGEEKLPSYTPPPTSRGGMNVEDLRASLEAKTAFCWAAVAVGVVAKVCEREREGGGGVLGDVRECAGVWKMVRLG